jgi:hypothetical protein
MVQTAKTFAFARDRWARGTIFNRVFNRNCANSAVRVRDFALRRIE